MSHRLDRIGIETELVSAPTGEVRELIADLDRELAEHYTAEQRHGLALDEIFQPGVRFFIARTGGMAMGCAGVAFFEGFAELKRMYVRDAVRGRGIAQVLLERIERETLESGRDVLRLETGTRQMAALRMYERAGFQPCAAFGAYAAMESPAIATSVFLEKRLDTAIQ